MSDVCDGLSSPAIVAIILGCIAFILLLVAILGCICLLMRPWFLASMSPSHRHRRRPSAPDDGHLKLAGTNEEATMMNRLQQAVNRSAYQQALFSREQFIQPYLATGIEELDQFYTRGSIGQRIVRNPLV
ncbi:uncharacterized protein LOC119720915 [Patiria miniata]|uniref:Uncharacterized protein n=1 Tax=Patiria miniata TaxID=46514 RepID=A0A913Z799_PATMI|nr:uncharacterized protein LOC119720915 [Patiria miniata]